MAIDDYLEPEIGVAVAITAALASPKVRGVLRKGAVYGLAGVLMAGDAVTSLAQGIKRGAASEAPAAADVAETPILVASETEVSPEEAKAVSKPRSTKAKGPAGSGDDTNE